MVKKIGGKSGNSPTVDAGPITAANYVVRANAFVRSKGLSVDENGDHPGGIVIRSGSAQWTAWLEYFDGKGISNACLRQKGEGTVPSEWPHEFESGWVISAPRLPIAPLAKKYDNFAEPWLQNAQWEMGINAQGDEVLFCPGPEADRCWQDHLAKTKGLPGLGRKSFPWLDKLLGETERERVMAGFNRLRAEADKAAQHMDMGNAIRGAQQKGQSSDFRTMKPETAEQRLEELAERYRASPVTLSGEAAAPFKHEPLDPPF
jgi:hypothetical protein